MMFKAFMVAGLLVTQSLGMQGPPPPPLSATAPAVRAGHGRVKPPVAVRLQVNEQKYDYREDYDDGSSTTPTDPKASSQASSEDSNDAYTASKFVDQIETIRNLPFDLKPFIDEKVLKRIEDIAKALMNIQGELYYDYTSYLGSGYGPVDSTEGFNCLLFLRTFNKILLDLNNSKDGALEKFEAFQHCWEKAEFGMMNLFISTYLATLPSKGENIRKCLKDTSFNLPGGPYTHTAAIFALKKLIAKRDEFEFDDLPVTNKKGKVKKGGKVEFDEEFKNALKGFVPEKMVKKFPKWKLGKGNMHKEIKTFFKCFIKAVIDDGIVLDKEDFKESWAQKVAPK